MILSHIHTSASDGLLDRNQILEIVGDGFALVTDHGNAYHAIAWHMENPRRFPFIGAEVYLRIPSETGGKERFAHLTIHAFHEAGVRTLFTVLRDVPAVEDFLSMDLTGLIVASGCMQSPFYEAVRKSEAEIWRLKERIEGRGGVFALEVFPHDMNERPDWFEWVERMSAAGALRAIFSTDSHAVPEDRDLYYFFLHMRPDRFEGALHPMKGGKKFAERMRQIEGYLFPDIRLPDHHPAHAINAWLESYVPSAPLWKPELPRFPDEEFAALVEDLRSRGADLKDDERERLEREIELIARLQIPEGRMQDYFVLLRHILEALRREGILFSIRGSGAASLAIWLMAGRSFPNPLRCGCLLERFINPYRVSSPDVDIDVNDQEAAFRALEKDFILYRLSTYATLEDEKSAVREHFLRMTGKNVRKEEVMFLLKKIYSPEKVDRIVELARVLTGRRPIVRIGQHAGGIIPVPRWQLSGMRPIPVFPDGVIERGTRVAMIDKETAGGTKIDVLQVNAIGVIWFSRPPVSLRAVPAEPLAYGSAGVFQLNGYLAGPFMAIIGHRGGMVELDLVRTMVAGIRPGGSIERLILDLRPNEKERSFLEQFPWFRNRQGEDIFMFQEDVMRVVANALIQRGVPEGTAWEMADVVRKAIAKKDESAWEKANKFLQNSGVDKQVTEKLERSFGYSFNMAHAIVYANHAMEAILRLAKKPIEFLIEFIREVERYTPNRHEGIAHGLFCLMIHAIREGMRVRIWNRETRILRGKGGRILAIGPDTLGNAIPNQFRLFGEKNSLLLETTLGYSLEGMMALAPLLAFPRGLHLTGFVGSVKRGRGMRTVLITPYGMFPIDHLEGVHPHRGVGMVVSHLPGRRQILPPGLLRKDPRFNEDLVRIGLSSAEMEEDDDVEGEHDDRHRPMPVRS